jgi:RimJ/RimL family protein N-acetyltransferase
MLELKPEQYKNVLPLFKNFKQAVLPQSVCEGFNMGRVFADDGQHPHSACIWTPIGYYLFVVGRGQNLDDVSKLLTETFIPESKSMGETGYILVAEFDDWREKTSALLNEREVIEIFRRPFTFNAEKFNANWREKIPAGFELKRVDEALAGQARILPIWKSPADFVSNGIGFALLDGNKIASVCTSVVVSSARVEIDIHTEEQYRRRGFASIVASALIEECLRQGKQPNWECFWDNEESTALALKLGFEQLADYPVYFWEE